ncbi:ribosome maturation factor RimM [Oscillospiraceae bacterium]|nr:ribosome maturation factor RimM [Oscillospiraceae bacterium]
MKDRFLEVGEIVNTHGIKGEVKIMPWADSPEFLCQFDTLYLDGKPVRLRSVRTNKTLVLASLEGVDTVEAAMRLKGKVLSIDRTGVVLPEGRHFLADLMGLTVLDAATGEELGVIQDILTPPAHEVYVVGGKGKEYMIPAVDAFLAETNVEEGYVRVNLIEGMES